MILPGRLRLRHLEVLHAIMASGSVTGAAEALGTSQPTVSRDLADLERALGVSLFVREGRRVRPSREAEFLYGEIARNYMCVADLLELARQVTRGEAGHLRVASVPSLAMQAVPEAIASLARTRPGCRFDLEVHGRDTIAGMMQAHRFDVVFTVVGGPETKGLTVEPLCTIRAVCVAHRASPLARLETVSPADLAGEPFISLAPSYLSRERVDEVFRRAGVFPHIFMTTQTAISACSVIRAGHGAAVLDPLTAYHALGEELCVRRFEPRVDFDYVAAFAHRGLARPLVRTAIEAVRERMQAVSSAMDRLVSQGI